MAVSTAPRHAGLCQPHLSPHLLYDVEEVSALLLPLRGEAGPWRVDKECARHTKVVLLGLNEGREGRP